ncbi:hypothetical protein ACRAWD_23895 [Caulobacter segnis]
MLAAGAVATDAPVLQPLGLLLDLTGEAMRARGCSWSPATPARKRPCAPTSRSPRGPAALR